jgi:hypothetical protein
MRLMLPRFTVRRMMVAVALIALPYGEIQRRRTAYLRIADSH